VTPGALESLHATVLDPENDGLEVAGVDAATMGHLMSFPLTPGGDSPRRLPMSAGHDALSRPAPRAASNNPPRTTR
jgi:type II secretory pathway component PulL